MYLTAPHSTTQHLTAPHSTTQHLTAPHSTSQHHTAPHSTTQHHTASHSTSQHLTAPHSTLHPSHHLNTLTPLTTNPVECSDEHRLPFKCHADQLAIATVDLQQGLNVHLGILEEGPQAAIDMKHTQTIARYYPCSHWQLLPGTCRWQWCRAAGRGHQRPSSFAPAHWVTEPPGSTCGPHQCLGHSLAGHQIHRRTAGGRSGSAPPHICEQATTKELMVLPPLHPLQ